MIPLLLKKSLLLGSTSGFLPRRFSRFSRIREYEKRARDEEKFFTTRILRGRKQRTVRNVSR